MALYAPGVLRTLLASSDAELAKGLSDSEFDDVEGRLDFRFGPDHREMLSEVLPLGERWPNWRDRSDADLRLRLEWPTDGVLFDVENNAFWPMGWGVRPGGLPEALELARERLNEVPQLVPIYSHRYLPALPCEPHSPVLSVYQTDVIYYGADLEDYLAREFGSRSNLPLKVRSVQIAFWSELAEGREDEI